MNLPAIGLGFVIGYNLIAGAIVLRDTATGEMPGPSIQGYFIGSMALLSAGLLYIISSATKEELDSYYDTNMFANEESQPIGTPMELGRPLDWEPYDERVSVLRHRKRAEDEELYCCICGVNLLDTGEKYGHNPDPIARLPNVCCGDCNAIHVIPARLKQMGFSAEAEAVSEEDEDDEWDLPARKEAVRLLRKAYWMLDDMGVSSIDTEELRYLNSIGLDFYEEAEEFKVTCREAYAITSKLYGDEPDQQGLKDGSIDEYELGWLIEAIRNDDFEAETFNADGERTHKEGWMPKRIGEMTLEQAEKALIEVSEKIRTRRYGRPNQFMMRKRGWLTQRIMELKNEMNAESFAAEKDAYNLAYNQGFDDGRSQRRVSKTVFAPDRSYLEDEDLFKVTYRRG